MLHQAKIAQFKSVSEIEFVQPRINEMPFISDS